MQVLSAASHDGTRLRLVRHGEGARNVLLVHGLAEHAGRYDHVIDHLVAAGHRVTLLELRGHGESEGRRGHTERWHRYIEDLQTAAATIRRPFALVAHSMGGLVVLDALREPLTPRCIGVALSNPLVEPASKVSGTRKRIVSRLADYVPWLPIRTELDTSLISRDREVVLAYEADPHVYPTVTVRWAVEMLEATRRVSDDPPLVDIPLRMMLGTADGICTPRGGRGAAARWIGLVSLVAYEGAYHELFNEPDKEVVLDGLTEWLDTLEWPDVTR